MSIDPAIRAPVPMLRVDRDGRVLWSNPAAGPLLRAWDVEPGGFLPPSECDRVALVAVNGVDTRSDQQIGGRAWQIDLCPSPAGDEVLVVGRDRTREAELEGRLVVADRAPALCPDPILRLAADGRLIWANSAAAPVLALLRARVGERLGPEWHQAVGRAAMDRTATSNVLEHPGGVWSLRLVPDLDGRSVYVFAQDTARAGSGDEEVAQNNFVANMGHELRTPLNAIVGYAELVQDELRSRGLDESVEDLDKVRGSAATLRALIDAMVDLAKLQAGRIQLQPSPFYIGDLLDDVVIQAASKAERGGNTLTVEVEAEPQDLEADPRRLSQILTELLDNACKFTEGGRIAIRVRDAEVGGRPGVAFEVHDTGIGLDAAELARLFRPYAQGDNSATRKYGGTGLGLAIARMLGRHMGGDVTVRSEPGRGSVFTLVLPREAAGA